MALRQCRQPLGPQAGCLFNALICYAGMAGYIVARLLYFFTALLDISFWEFLFLFLFLSPSPPPSHEATVCTSSALYIKSWEITSILLLYSVTYLLGRLRVPGLEFYVVPLHSSTKASKEQLNSPPTYLPTLSQYERCGVAFDCLCIFYSL